MTCSKCQGTDVTKKHGKASSYINKKEVVYEYLSYVCRECGHAWEVPLNNG